jgi:hypothetical protein
MTTKTCKVCVEEKALSFFGLDKGKPRTLCKACFNKNKKMKYVMKNDDAVAKLKETIARQNDELFLQKELMKKYMKVIKENDLEMPRITKSDEVYMYQFLYC